MNLNSADSARVKARREKDLSKAAEMGKVAPLPLKIYTFAFVFGITPGSMAGAKARE
jgi:hypothetical protein